MEPTTNTNILGPGISVFLIDDSQASLSAIKAQLEGYGCVVSGFLDPKTATGELALKKPDVVITDLEMPNMNGIEFVRSLRDSGTCDETPILMLTGNYDEATMVRAIQAGVDAFVSKSSVKEVLAVQLLALTRLRRLFQESARVRQEAQKQLIQTSRLSSLGEMAGGIAHEINNPLGIVRGKAEQLLRMIQQGRLTPEHGTKELKKIVEMTERMAKIIKGLRAFSRNADNDPFDTTTLKTLVENVLSFCSEKFKIHAIKLEVAPIPEVKLICRAIQIEQVMLNVLSNAFDAVMPLSEKWIHLDFKIHEEVLLISITDSGKGIPPHIADKIMQPFFTTKEVGKGTGLGLSVGKGIIEDHQGRLRHDTSCSNTRFVIELPLRQRKVEGQAA